MKKFTLPSIFMLALSLLFVSCSQPREWSAEEHQKFVTTLEPYRQMAYLDEFNDAEFVVFSSDIGTLAEGRYPLYTEFIALPSLSDTLDVWVVTSIVEQLDTNAENMRYLYPYHTLVNQEILPEGMDHAERKGFYTCLSEKVNSTFPTMEAFFISVVNNALEEGVITEMMTECGF